MPAATSEEITALSKTTVAVHPLVLLSVVDHAARVARGTKRRVVGILLGQNDGKRINVANSFAGEVNYTYRNEKDLSLSTLPPPSGVRSRWDATKDKGTGDSSARPHVGYSRDSGG